MDNQDTAPKSRILVTIIVLVVLVFLIVYFSAKKEPSRDSVEVASIISEERSDDAIIFGILDPRFELTEKERNGDVAEKKEEILSKVKSGVEMSDEEKSEIVGIMLLKADAYKFSEEERDLILKVANQ